jgi:GntR family transcriptional regulator/MocR family aminotransferase
MKGIDLTLWKMGNIVPGNLRYQVEEFILERIANKDVYMLPSQRSFAAINNLEPSLVKRAYLNLVSLGHLKTKIRSGTTVAAHVPDKETVYKESPFTEALPVGLDVFDVTTLGPPPVVYNFRPIGLDRLSEHFYPKALNKYLRFHRKRYENITQMEQIRASSGPQYKNAIRNYLNMHGGFKLNNGCLSISMDRQESLTRIFSLLLKPGDGVIHTAAQDILLGTVWYGCQAKVYELSTLNPDFIAALKRRLKTTPIKAVYVNAQCGYPEGNHLSSETCLELIKLAKKHRFYIVEENDFHEFWYTGGQDFIPLANYDHDGHVIHTAPLSQSSIYMYNTRIIAASKAFISLLEAIPSKPYALRDIIEELAIIDLINSGELWYHAKYIRHIKEGDRHDLYMELYNYLGDWMVIQKPASGLCFWLTFPPEVDINKAMGYLNEKAIDVPYNPFVPLIMDKVFHMRLAFATFNLLEAQAAAKLLKQMFEDLGIPKLN